MYFMHIKYHEWILLQEVTRTSVRRKNVQCAEPVSGKTVKANLWEAAKGFCVQRKCAQENQYLRKDDVGVHVRREEFTPWNLRKVGAGLWRYRFSDQSHCLVVRLRGLRRRLCIVPGSSRSLEKAKVAGL